MDTPDKLLLILDKISEGNERQARIETKIEIMNDDIQGIKAEDRKQNELLAEHIQGTVANTERLNLEIQYRQELDTRVKKLEKVPQFLSSAHKVLLYSGTVIGIVYEAGRILHKW